MTNRAYAYELSSLFKHTQQADVYSAQASSSSCCASVDFHHRRIMACDPSSVPVLAIFRGCVRPFHIETENRPYQIDAFLRLDIRFPSERIEEEKWQLLIGLVVSLRREALGMTSDYKHADDTKIEYPHSFRPRSISNEDIFGKCVALFSAELTRLDAVD